MQKDEATVDAYMRILRQFTAWMAKLPGHGGQFAPSQLTTTAVERYLSVLKELMGETTRAQLHASDKA